MSLWVYVGERMERKEEKAERKIRERQDYSERNKKYTYAKITHLLPGRYSQKRHKRNLRDVDWEWGTNNAGKYVVNKAPAVVQGKEDKGVPSGRQWHWGEGEVDGLETHLQALAGHGNWIFVMCWGSKSCQGWLPGFCLGQLSGWNPLLS